MSLSTNGSKLQQWLERYKETATALYNRIGVNKLRNGSAGIFTNALEEVKATDLVAPASFAGTAEDDRVLLTWANISGETGFTIVVATDPTFTYDVQTHTVGSGILTYTPTGLNPSTPYWFKVYGNETGHDANATVINVDTHAALVASPSLVASLTYDTNLVQTWSAVPNATSYVLERATAADFSTGLTTVYSGARAPFSDSGLTPATQYWYRVHGTASTYNIISYTTDTVTTLTALTAPSIPIASSVGNTSMTLTWGTVTGATGYVLQRSASSSFTSPTSVYTGSGLTFTDSGLTASTTYYYRVHATATGYTTITNSATCIQETT